MKAAGTRIFLPHNPAPYLADWLFEVGPAAGDREIGYSDLAAWQDITGIELEPWEGRLLRRLSRAWLNEQWQARKAARPAPFSGIDDTPKSVRESVAEQMAAMFRALAGRSKK